MGFRHDTHRHLNHFEESKKFGEILIVSITQDEFVNKGPNRPVFNILQRAKLISGLKVVDYVVVNNKATAENVINIIKPDYYIKEMIIKIIKKMLLKISKKKHKLLKR